MKKLALFLDGTWNDPDDNTNVWRLKLMLADRDDEGHLQTSYYDAGVGTHWNDRFLGGAFGRGLSINLRAAYQWLLEKFEDGDQIYIFGFSRGAFTARSLAGLIKQCGILRPGVAMTTGQVFARYSEGGIPLFNLEYWKRHPEAIPTGVKFGAMDELLLQSSRRPEIEMLGVWDTVGALGVPFGRLRGISQSTLRFHNTYPSKIYRNCYQALAIDEHRKAYAPTLWTRFLPTVQAKNEDPDSHDSREIEQRWFIGAHSNIGGGYPADPLAQIPLEWMQRKAIRHGLRFREVITLVGNEWECSPADSFSEFLKGGYALLHGGKRHYRPIQRPQFETISRDGTPGIASTINETVDTSALRKILNGSSYRPANLAEWMKLHKEEIPTS